MPEHTPAPTPSRAVYGFAMYLSFRTFIVLYLLWAIIPESWFLWVGITCLPQRYWAVALPMFFLNVLAIFAFLIYPNLGLYMTPYVDDLRTIRDSQLVRKLRKKSVFTKQNETIGDCCCVNKDKCFKDKYEKCLKDLTAKPIPPLQDLNIWDVSDHLYVK